MKVLHGDYLQWDPGFDRLAVTVGVYDGVHLGHQAVLSAMQRHSGGAPLAVLTFVSHPLLELAPEHAPLMISSLDQRLELLAAAGVDVVGLLEFDETLRQTSAHDFVALLLVGSMRASCVAVGADFRFGYQRSGDVALLHQLSRSHGFEVVALDLETAGTEVVSSTAIRSAVGKGEVSLAARLLGRPFSLRGRVVPGDGRGRTIGVPTANLELDAGQMKPKRGVYAATVDVGGSHFGGVVNVGVRPTFGGDPAVIVEVHVLEFDSDLYGNSVEVFFIDRIRDEERFGGVDELVAQIRRDIDSAKIMLARS